MDITLSERFKEKLLGWINCIELDNLKDSDAFVDTFWLRFDIDSVLKFDCTSDKNIFEFPPSSDHKPT